MSVTIAPPMFLQFLNPNNSGSPASGFQLFTYVAGTSTKQATWTDSTQTVQNANPLPLDSNGVGNFWGDPTLAYKFVWALANDTDPPSSPIRTVDNLYFPLSLGALTQQVLGGILYPLTAAESAAAVTPVNLAYSPTPVGDARRYCTLVLDGSTDNTAAISGMWTALATYRGPVTIPYNCKFNKATIYSTIPVGVLLIDQSSINTGQPPGAKNKHIDQITNDTAADDATQGIISSHHPGLRLNNLHTAGTSSATGAYHSILFAYGYRWNNDAIDLMQYLTFLGPRGTAPIPLTRSAWLVNTKAQAAVKSTRWLGATFFATGSVADTSSGGVWINNGAGATTAATEPTGTGPTFNDGGITWTYLYAWSVGQTVLYIDEDGYGAAAGTTTARWGAETANRKGISINSNDTTHDVWIADDQKAVDLWRLSDAAGLRHGGIRSLNYAGAISGATPTISGEIHTVNNGGATNMTNILLPGSQTSGYVILQFTNSNTTLKATGFNLKGGVDVTPASGNIITLYKEPSISGTWTEISRNF